MSIAIWEAYRINPRHDMWTVAMRLREKAHARAVKMLGVMLRNVIAEGHANDPWSASKWVEAQYHKAIATDERNMFDLDVSIVFRKSSVGWLVIPYPGSGFLSSSLVHLRRDPSLADYHYQNSADKSAKCSDRAWNARVRVWHEVLDEPKWSDKFVVEVMSFGRFRHVSPWTTIGAKPTDALTRARVSVTRATARL